MAQENTLDTRAYLDTQSAIFPDISLRDGIKKRAILLRSAKFQRVDFSWVYVRTESCTSGACLRRCQKYKATPMLGASRILRAAAISGSTSASYGETLS